MLSCCRSQGLEPLVEVVTDRELEAPLGVALQRRLATPCNASLPRNAFSQIEVALRAGAKVLGVNNRNLHTLVLDKHRTQAISQETRDVSKPDRKQCLSLVDRRVSPGASTAGCGSWHGGEVAGSQRPFQR